MENPFPIQWIVVVSMEIFKYIELSNYLVLLINSSLLLRNLQVFQDFLQKLIISVLSLQCRSVRI